MHAPFSLSAFLQVPTYTMTDGQFHTLLWFTGLIAFWLLLQAIALIGVAIMVIKLLRTVNDFTGRVEEKTLAITDRFESKLYPLLDSVQTFMNDAVPKVKRITDNIADTTDVYRSKVAEVDSFLSDTTAKAKRQSDRIDGMVTDTLTTVGNLAGRVEHVVLSPVRQAGALLSGIRAAAGRLSQEYSKPASPKTPKPIAFTGDSIYTGVEDDYHA